MQRLTLRVHGDPLDADNPDKTWGACIKELMDAVDDYIPTPEP
jgi:translation elongation factor EF-Tu-like GTPase